MSQFLVLALSCFIGFSTWAQDSSSPASPDDSVLVPSEPISAPKKPRPDVELPDYLEGSWTEASRNEEIDSFSIRKTYHPNSAYILTQEQTRQVGREETPNVPYPTMCRYKQVSTITSFEQTDEKRKQYYRDNGKQAPTFTIKFTVTNISLLPALFNSPACREYIAETKRKIQMDEVSYWMELTDLNDRVLLDPWYNTVFVK